MSEWQSQYELVKNQESYVIKMRNLTHEFFINHGNLRRHLDIIDNALLDVDTGWFPKNDFGFLRNPQFEGNLYLFIVASINLNKKFLFSIERQNRNDHGANKTKYEWVIRGPLIP